MRCEEIQEMLPGKTPDGDTTLMLRRHLAHCKACSLEAERYEALAASLSSLSIETARPPAYLYRRLADIPRTLSRSEKMRTHVTRNKKVYAGGAAVLLGAAGAALWRSRARGLAVA